MCQEKLFCVYNWGFHLKTVDKSTFCGRIFTICKGIAETKQSVGTTSEREAVKALCRTAASHFQAAREDRDGCARYSASKMSLWDKLGWYRDQLRPYVWAGFIFL